MAMLTGPCFSTKASGTMADLLNYRTGRRGTSVRRRPVPKQPETAAQIATRTIVGGIAQQWQDLSANQRATWNDLAEELHLAPYHAYQQYNIRRFTTDQGATQEYPAADTGTVTLTGNIYALAFFTYISVIYWPFLPHNQSWFPAIHRGSPGFQISPANITHVFRGFPTTYFNYMEGRMPAGTYQYAASITTTSGKIYNDTQARATVVWPGN